ncbi:MAPEG family protein [Thiotrichales bacterium 19S3-7]|nr:MAPEG family protein [Thiotrichales bacterium 19S3-7]MCF6800854.1 MAPEG family protein [Thiotrichales bacterium 19S3-11]
MTISTWCIVISCLLPYAWIILAKCKKGYLSHNDAPRLFLEKLHGYRQRAHWASQNSFEALPIFIAAILTAQFFGNISITTLNTLAVCFIAFRILYGILYLLNLATLRSLAWMIAFFINIAIFLIVLI